MNLVSFLLPFFGLIALGYYAGRMGWISAAGVSGMNAFVIRFAMPCLIIKVIADTSLPQIFNGKFLIAYLGAETLTFTLALCVTLYIFRRSLGDAALLGMASSWGNVGYMGIPLAASLFGPQGALPALLATATDMVVVTGVTVLLAEYHQKRGSMAVGSLIAQLAYKLFTHPFIITIIIGLGLAYTQSGIPAPLERSVDFLAGGAGPAALFAIGASLAVRPLKGEAKEIIAPVALKLFALPLVFAGLGLAMGLPKLWLTTGIVLAALPTAGNVFVIAEQYGAAVQRVSATILVSTGISVVTVMALLVWTLRT